jgi:hypothetical protein
MASQWRKDFLSGWIALTAIWAGFIAAAVCLEAEVSPDDRLLWHWMLAWGWAVLATPSLALFAVGMLVVWLIGDTRPAPAAVRLLDP